MRAHVALLARELVEQPHEQVFVRNLFYHVVKLAVLRHEAPVFPAQEHHQAAGAAVRLCQLKLAQVRVRFTAVVVVVGYGS